MPPKPTHTLTVTNSSMYQLKIMLVVGQKTMNGTVAPKKPNKPQPSTKTLKFKEQNDPLPLRITANEGNSEITRAETEISGKQDSRFSF